MQLPSKSTESSHPKLFEFKPRALSRRCAGNFIRKWVAIFCYAPPHLGMISLSLTLKTDCIKQASEAQDHTWSSLLPRRTVGNQTPNFWLHSQISKPLIS